jgi:alkanesulfonate monooxygenase SsuD/methylene tetrahydromethanopterin reductase-like flavin-dependent oxidoreductase (luciferase family)
VMAEGRMLLAACTGIVGGGASAREGAPFGVTDRERAARLEENIAICRELWSKEDVSFEGRFRSFTAVTVRPRPVQQPCPIWIASNPRPALLQPTTLERALRRVALLADGWMTVQLAPGMLAGSWSRIRAYLAEEGRRPEDFPTMAYHNVNIAPTRQAALEESKRFLDDYYGPVFSPPVVEAWTAAGPPTECIEHLRSLRRDGAKTIALRITSWRQEEQFARLVNEVLPKV